MGNKPMYELTNPQKSIYLTEEYFKGAPINNICGSLIIKQETNLEILNRAINLFIKNNDSFKLRFVKKNGEVFQYLSENENFNFELLDITHECQIEEFAKRMVNTRFNLIDSRLFDFKLFKLPSGFGGFIVNVHHIISDAVTFSIIATEVVQNYSRLIKNEEIPTKTYSYIDYINSEKEYLKSSRFEKDKAYWETSLNPLPDIASISMPKRTSFQNSVLDESPNLTKEISNSEIQASRKEFILDSTLIKKIKNYCSENKISMFNFLTGVYSIYIGKLSNMSKFLLGTPILNRTNFAEKHISGMFISTSLLNIDMSQNMSFSEFLKNIAETSMQMLRHQKYSYQYILEDVRKIDKSVSNLYDIILSYQISKATDSTLDIPYSTKWYGTDYVANIMDIHFHDNDNTGNLLIEYDYQISKYTCEDIKNMHSRILEIINQVLENPKIGIFDIEIISQKEKNELLDLYSNNNKDFDFSSNIFEQIKINTKDNLNNIAIETSSEKITYKELIERVNKLSNYLLTKETRSI